MYVNTSNTNHFQITPAKMFIVSQFYSIFHRFRLFVVLTHKPPPPSTEKVTSCKHIYQISSTNCSNIYWVHVNSLGEKLQTCNPVVFPKIRLHENRFLLIFLIYKPLITRRCYHITIMRITSKPLKITYF